MTFKRLSLLILTVFAFYTTANAQLKDDIDQYQPDQTLMFAQIDTSKLYLDIYRPQAGSQTEIDGVQKPTILYVFGGGFAFGERDAILQKRWYRQLTENGFQVIAIDYRLGLKNLDPNEKTSRMKIMERAMYMAVDDLLTATKYLLDNGKELGVDAENMVIVGSSAGGVTVLQADYMLSRGMRDQLPADFRYKGVICLSGGIYSKEGKVDYGRTPSPTLLIHGTKDKIVVYNKIRFGKLGFFGANALAKRMKKYNANYNIIRFKDKGHDVAGSLRKTFNEQMDFIYTNVMKGEKRIVDATIQDPNISEKYLHVSLKQLYKMGTDQ